MSADNHEQCDEVEPGLHSETILSALTNKATTRKSQNLPLKAGGAVVSPMKQHWRLTGVCEQWQWQVNLMRGRVLCSCTWIPCAAFGDRIIWTAKQTCCALLPLQRCSIKSSVNISTCNRQWRKHFYLAKNNPLRREALNNQWILIKSTTATVRLVQMRRPWSGEWCSVIHDNPESHSSAIRQSSFPNLWVSHIINIDVDTQILPVTGADNPCCGWTESGPVFAPDTLQLYVTDAWCVHTHINTLRYRMKSPYLTLTQNPLCPSTTPPPARLLCSLGVCDQMWPYYKFNKDVEMQVFACLCVCDRLWD